VPKFDVALNTHAYSWVIATDPCCWRLDFVIEGPDGVPHRETPWFNREQWLFNAFEASVPGTYEVTVTNSDTGELVASGSFVVSSATALPPRSP